MIKKFLFVLLLFSILFISCDKITTTYNELTYDKNDSLNIGRYKTEYTIHYDTYHCISTIMYSDKEVYTCSFQGTNYLLEKDNTEELVSTTAPIEIVKSYKIE